MFKLEEIDRRAHLLSPGKRVLDLGAAPGSWSRYAAERVGARGSVVAVDRQGVSGLPGNVTVVRADVFAPLDDPADVALAAVLAGAPYDVVLSDMAPATSGAKVSDQARSHALFTRALELAVRLGKPGSAYVGKIFMSGDFPEARRAVEARYRETRVMKPEGTRRVSTEVYVLGLGLRPGA